MKPLSAPKQARAGTHHTCTHFLDTAHMWIHIVIPSWQKQTFKHNIKCVYFTEVREEAGCIKIKTNLSKDSMILRQDGWASGRLKLSRNFLSLLAMVLHFCRCISKKTVKKCEDLGEQKYEERKYAPERKQQDTNKTKTQPKAWDRNSEGKRIPRSAMKWKRNYARTARS